MILTGKGEQLDIIFAYDTYQLILLHIISIFILVSVNFTIWLKAKKIPLLYAYLSVQCILLLWMTAKILKTIAPNEQLKMLFVIVQYLGICFIGVIFLAFAFLYAKGRLPAGKTMILLCIVPSLTLMTLITNSYHGLFYAHFDFWGDSFGPVFYIHQAYNYLLITLGILLCSKYFFRQFEAKRVQAALFSLAILIPLAVNIIYVFGWSTVVFGFSPPCDITPISCNLSLFMFALAIFRYKFFDDVKIARSKALDSHPDGILILDNNDRIVTYNKTFLGMYNNDLLDLKTACVTLTPGRKKPLLEGSGAVSFLAPLSQRCDETYETRRGNYYRISCRPIIRKRNVYGMSIQFSNVTFRQHLLEKTAHRNDALTIANKDLQKQAGLCRDLTVARTRNFIAGEVHDILGHSIVLVISLLEAAKLSLEKSESDIRSLLVRAKSILENTLKKSTLQELESESVENDPLEPLRAMIMQINSASVTVELTVTGRLPLLSNVCADTIFKLCREGVTNAIRHGFAERIDIILRNRPEALEVYVIDNGRGCKTEVHNGMGISGIKERLQPLGGNLRFGPQEGGGFMLHADIPIK